MYAGAQRVRSRDGRKGINAFLYSHDVSSILVNSSGHIDYHRIATLHPGRLVDSSQDVPRGYNDVLSFLDVAALDSVEVADVIRLLDRLESEIPSVTLPKEWPGNEITIAFSAGHLSGEPAQLEYVALRRRLVDFLSSVRTR